MLMSKINRKYKIIECETYYGFAKLKTLAVLYRIT